MWQEIQARSSFGGEFRFGFELQTGTPASAAAVDSIPELRALVCHLSGIVGRSDDRNLLQFRMRTYPSDLCEGRGREQKLTGRFSPIAGP